MSIDIVMAIEGSASNKSRASFWNQQQKYCSERNSKGREHFTNYLTLKLNAMTARARTANHVLATNIL